MSERRSDLKAGRNNTSIITDLSLCYTDGGLMLQPIQYISSLSVLPLPSFTCKISRLKSVGGTSLLGPSEESVSAFSRTSGSLMTNDGGGNGASRNAVGLAAFVGEYAD